MRQLVRSCLSAFFGADLFHGLAVFYFSEALSSAPATAETQAAELSPDVQPFDVFVPAQNHFANLWLGSPGVVAQTHYDQDPNFAIQIRGHKRWILSPPSQALKLVPFPYLHSSYRQSMLNFTSGSLVDDISVEDAHSKGLVRDVVGSLEGTVAAFQVVAGPGNVLYLPPLWFHRVVTEDTSIAISAYSACLSLSRLTRNAARYVDRSLWR